MADGSPGTQALMIFLFLRYVARLLDTIMILFYHIEATRASLEDIQDFFSLF